MPHRCSSASMEVDTRCFRKTKLQVCWAVRPFRRLPRHSYRNQPKRGCWHWHRRYSLYSPSDHCSQAPFQVWLSDTTKGLIAFNAMPNGSGVLTQITVPGSGGLTKFHRPVFGNNNGKKPNHLSLTASGLDTARAAFLALVINLNRTLLTPSCLSFRHNKQPSHRHRWPQTVDSHVNISLSMASKRCLGTLGLLADR